MKKNILLAAAVLLTLSAKAATYTDGTNTLTVTQADGLYTLSMGSLNVTAPGASTNGYTVVTGDGVTARFTADYAVVDNNGTIVFNNVANHFQLPNGDFETWTASSGEPDRWHGFKSASGGLASMASSTLTSSTDTPHGSGCSAMMGSTGIWGVVANGTMTNGRLNAGSPTAANTANHSAMDQSWTDTDNNGDPFYMQVYAKPDAIKFWLKFSQGTASTDFPYATMNAVVFDGTYYQDPEDTDYNNKVGAAQNNTITTCDWSEFNVPFNYSGYPSTNAQAILVTFSTNATPGKGSSSDTLWVDDIELVYNARINSLLYQGSAPAATITWTNDEAPSLDDFTVEYDGQDAKLVKNIATTDQGYVVTIALVSADLLTVDVRTIIFENQQQGSVGDVNGDGSTSMSDVTSLISYILGNNPTPFVISAADVNGDGGISMSDVTTLIRNLLGN